MTAALAVLGIVALTCALQVWCAHRIGRYVKRQDRIEGVTTRARFLGGRR